MKTHKYILLLLLLVFAGRYEGMAQHPKNKVGVTTEDVIWLRNDLLNEIQLKNYEKAKLIKDTLLFYQEVEGSYLSYREYCIVLLLNGEFEELLCSYSSSEKTVNLEENIKPVEDDLKVVLKNREEDVLLLINEHPEPKERPTLRIILQRLIYYKSLNREPWFSIIDNYDKERQSKNSSDNFVYLFNDSKIFCDDIEYDRKFLARNQFKCADTSILANEVKFYQDANGFYANIKKEGRHHKFFKRYKSGSINYYKKDYMVYHYGYTSPGYYNPATGSWTPGYSTPSYDEHVLIQYYNFGYEDIKRATYKNLVKDISHNSSSKYYLNRYRKKNRTENTLAIIGGSLTLGGLALIAVSPGGGAIAATSGFLLLCVDLWIIIPNNDKEVELGNAIKAYY